MSRPRDMPSWMRWVEGKVASAQKQLRSFRQVPVGSVVRWPNGVALPDGWLAIEDGSFPAADYPLLADVLGGNQMPTPAQGADNSTVWIIRAD